MAEKEIRLPKWDGKEYYPATTTEAVADRERQKGLNEVLSDIEHTIDSYNRANQIMLNQKQNKLNNYKEDPSNGSVDIYAQDTVSMRNDSQGGVSTIEVYNEDNTEGVFPVARVSSEKENGDYAYIEARGNEVNIVGDYVTVNGADLSQTIQDVATLNGTGEGSVSKTVTDEIAKVVAKAPSDFDTLKEIADYIASDQTNAAEINNTLDRHTSEITSLQNNKQDALANYVEEPRGKTTIKYPNGNARVEVGKVSAAILADDDKVSITADANGARMRYTKTAEDGSVEHRDEISIGRHDENSATHITLTSKSTTEVDDEKVTQTSSMQVTPEGISMSSPEVSTNATSNITLRTEDAEGNSAYLYMRGGEKAELNIYTDSELTIYGNNSVSVSSDNNIEFSANSSMSIKATDAISMQSGENVIDDVVKEITDKAPKVGYAPELKVNFAKELVGRGESTPEVIGSIRPTGVRSIGDGNATITKVKGESVVWNQRVKPFQEADIRQSGSNITYYGNDVTIINWEKQRPFRFNLQLQKNIGHQFLFLLDYTNTNADERILVQFGAESPSMLYRGRIVRFFSNSKAYTGTYADYLTIYLAADSENTITLSNLCVFDLTQMFGSGNEPTTLEDFEARKPLGVSNEYNEGTIISYDGSALKSVGFNAYNGTYAKVIGGEEYHATGTTSISFAEELDGDTTAITLDSNGKFTPTEDGYVYAEGKDIVIHLTHSYTPDHVDEYEEDVHLLPDVKSILDADGNQLFPYGLCSAGCVYDEITETKAIKRVGHKILNGTENWYSVLYGMNTFAVRVLNDNAKHKYNQVNWLSNRYENKICGDGWSNITDKMLYVYNNDINIIGVVDTTHATVKEFMNSLVDNPIILYYELAKPIEVDLPEPLNMTYEAWDFGTEELVHDGATTPLNAEIVYQFNAVDRIRENSSAIEDLEEHVEEHKNDGIKLLDNGNLKLTLKGETREFMPATPSGDPMHWAYVSAGAEYNATTDYILKDAPWKDMVDTIEDKAKWSLDVVDASQVKQMTIGGVEYNYATENRTSPEGGTYLRYFLVGQSNGVWVEDETKVLHLPGYWYLNGLGDITNAEMRRILENKFIASVWEKGRAIQSIKTRTLLHPYTLRYFDGIGGIANLHGVWIESFTLHADYFKNVSQEFCIPTGIIAGNQPNLKYFACSKNLKSIGHNNVRVLPINKLSTSVTISSPVISKESVKQNILNATPTSAIVITLHADAYARLAEDADIVAALETKNTALEGSGGSVSLVSA